MTLMRQIYTDFCRIWDVGLRDLRSASPISHPQSQRVDDIGRLVVHDPTGRRPVGSRRPTSPIRVLSPCFTYPLLSEEGTKGWWAERTIQCGALRTTPRSSTSPRLHGDRGVVDHLSWQPARHLFGGDWRAPSLPRLRRRCLF